MSQSRVSVIVGRNRDLNSDHLYDPLRKTLLEDTTAKKTFLQSVSRLSHVTHNTKIHNRSENIEIGERTLIPEDVRLVRKQRITALPDISRYYIINAEERTYAPISQLQFQNRVNKNQEEVIVYTYGNEQQSIQEKTQYAFEPPLRRKPSGIRVTQPKYNLFSLIDEPLNNLLSGKACTCPANEIIAADKKQLVWEVE